MSKKRTSLFVVVIVFILTLPLASSGSFADKMSVSDKYSAYHCNDFEEDDDPCDTHASREVTLVSAGDFPICDTADDNYNFKKQTIPSFNGCWFAAGAVYNDEDSVWANLQEQTRFVPWDKNPEEVDFTRDDLRYILSDEVISQTYYDEDMASELKEDSDLEVTCFFPQEDTWIGDYELHLTTGGEVMCSSDHMWHECNEENKGKLTWAANELERFGVCFTHYYGRVPSQCASNPNEGRDIVYDQLYECTLVDEFYYQWIPKGKDEDHDGYITPSQYHRGYCAANPEDLMCQGIDRSLDCSDDPSSDPDFCSEVEEVTDCESDVKYRQCAICINPSAPEVCGDNINNDCRGDDNADGTASSAAVDDLDGKTPDDCNFFKEGCEQKVLGEDAVPDPYAEESAEEPIPVQHRNVDNGYYSWINTDRGGYCCGYANGGEDKSGDVGKLGPEEVEGTWEDDRYVCLPSPGSQTAEFEHDVIGHASANPPGWENQLCGEKDWCWIHTGAE